MISCPSDVREKGALDLIRQAVDTLNDINKVNMPVVLEVTDWKDAYPTMSTAGQQAINEQILSKCDILIVLFWGRIGTPTKNYVSGTVEELEKHNEAGKEVMVYFLKEPILPDDIDPDQIKKLKAFKESIQDLDRGLYKEFDKLDDSFKTLMMKDIQQCISNLNNRPPKALTGNPQPIEQTPQSRSTSEKTAFVVSPQIGITETRTSRIVSPQSRIAPQTNSLSERILRQTSPAASNINAETDPDYERSFKLSVWERLRKDRLNVEPLFSLEAASEAARAKNKPILAFVYNLAAEKQNYIESCLNSFLGNQKTRDQINTIFILACISSEQVSAKSDIIKDKSKPGPWWVIFNADLKALEACPAPDKEMVAFYTAARLAGKFSTIVMLTP